MPRNISERLRKRSVTERGETVINTRSDEAVGFLVRMWRWWAVIEDGLHYREGDYLLERLVRLEQELAALKKDLDPASVRRPTADQ